jgi:hypothetical protein
MLFWRPVCLPPQTQATIVPEFAWLPAVDSASLNGALRSGTRCSEEVSRQLLPIRK